MKNFEMTRFEEIVADEMFPEIMDDSIFDSENFPVKDRKQASARRKKTYFKGKKRFDRLCDFGFEPLIRNTKVIHGMLRETNVIRATLDRNSEVYRFKNRSTIRRLNVANDKLAEYAYMEVG